jgi:hypothetical protein
VNRKRGNERDSDQRNYRISVEALIDCKGLNIEESAKTLETS